MDRSGIRKVPEVSGEQRKMEESSCEVICGAPTTLTVKENVKVKMLIAHTHLLAQSEARILSWSGGGEDKSLMCLTPCYV